MGGPDSLCLALDLGTTGNRAIVFDGTQKIRACAYEEFPQIYPRPGWVEHDAEAIWACAERVLRRALRAAGRPKGEPRLSAGRVAALGITNQRETVLLWDRRTGRPIHHAIVWQCRRTAPLCLSMKRRGLESDIHAKTGLFLDAYFSASKIQWLLDHVPGARRRAQNGDLLAGTIDSWVIWKLTGGRCHVTDASNASRTMLFNLRSKSWDEGLCRLFRVPRAVLPRVVASSGVCGVTDRRVTGEEIPIAGIVGDQQGASFAQGCAGPGIVKNTYGTGLFMMQTTGASPRFSKNLLTTVAWSLGDLSRTEYAVEGSVFIGGAAVQWLRDGLGVIRKASETKKLASSLASNDGVYFVPALVGLGAPYWDASARGMLIGITRGTTRAHLCRAALEAIAFQTRDVLEVMQKDTGFKFRVLRVDGGASANDFLMQLQADTLGIPVERPVVLETTALGAAGLAGLAVGMWKSRDAFNRLRRVDRVFRPRGKRAAQDRSYRRWKEAVRRSLAWERL